MLKLVAVFRVGRCKVLCIVVPRDLLVTHRLELVGWGSNPDVDDCGYCHVPQSQWSGPCPVWGREALKALLNVRRRR